MFRATTGTTTNWMSVPNDLSFSIFQKLVMTILGSPTLRFPLIPHHNWWHVSWPMWRSGPRNILSAIHFYNREKGAVKEHVAGQFFKGNPFCVAHWKRVQRQKSINIFCVSHLPCNLSIFPRFSCSTSLIHLSAYLPPRIFWHLDTNYPKNTGITSGVLKHCPPGMIYFFFDLPKNLSRLG